MNSEVNLLSMYQGSLATLADPAKLAKSIEVISKLDIGKKHGNFATGKKLLIEDIRSAIQENNKINPRGYLSTRLFNRATKKIENTDIINTTWTLNTTLLDNLKKGVIEEELSFSEQQSKSESTHYVIPNLLYDLDSNFQMKYRLPAGFYIFRHYNPWVEAGQEFNIFKFSKPIDAYYSLSSLTLFFKDQEISEQFKYIGNYSTSGGYCLGGGARLSGVNIIGLVLASQFSFDYVDSSFIETAKQTKSWAGGFDKQFTIGQATKEEIFNSIQENNISNFMDTSQIKYLQELSSEATHKFYTIE